MNTINILTKLVSIPSFVDAQTDESQLADFIVQELQKSKVPSKKQQVIGNRYNILAGNDTNPKILVCGHMDTVKPTTGWKTSSFVPTEKKGKLYGLGASDMKAGLAVMLSTLINLKPPNAIFLFYCDEEYDFLGMKAFVKKYQKTLSPRLIISMDGENLQIGNSCRGLIEMTLVIRGKSGHSGNPDIGINAITKSIVAFTQLELWLTSYKTLELGQSTMNIAAISGGAFLGQKNGAPLLSREGNVIPDYCEVILEVRPSDPQLTASSVINKLKLLLQQQKLTLESSLIRHNLGSWITPQDQLKELLKQTPTNKMANPMDAGYTDIQMLWESFRKAPTLSFGPAELDVAHATNEFVRISSLRPAQAFLIKLLNKGAET